MSIVSVTVLDIFIILKGHPSGIFMGGRIIISCDKSLGREAAVQFYPVGAIGTHGSIFLILAEVLKEIGILDYF